MTRDRATYMREYRKKPEVLEKKKKADREYAARNKEKALVRATEYYQNNTEKVKKYQADRRLSRKLELMSLLGGKCNRCQTDHPAAIDFHHLDPATKRFRISDAIMRTKKYSWQEIVDEVMKCELLCKNCHAIEHCTWDLGG